MMYDVWERLRIPKHETVEQWEERTGETYPLDWPIWLKIDSDSWSVGWILIDKDTWLDSYNNEMAICIVFNPEHGKPEDK